MSANPKPANQPVKKGWWSPHPHDTRTKYHYIDEAGRSLCGKWLPIAGELEDALDDHSQNCAECKRRKRKADARAVK